MKEKDSKKRKEKKIRFLRCIFLLLNKDKKIIETPKKNFCTEENSIRFNNHKDQEDPNVCSW